MKMLNRIVPNIDPSGAPIIISSHLLSGEPILTRCLLFD